MNKHKRKRVGIRYWWACNKRDDVDVWSDRLGELLSLCVFLVCLVDSTMLMVSSWVTCSLHFHIYLLPNLQGENSTATTVYTMLRHNISFSLFVYIIWCNLYIWKLIKSSKMIAQNCIIKTLNMTKRYFTQSLYRISFFANKNFN